jgi:hypothetical protein
MTDHYTGFRAGVVTVGSPSDDVNPFLNASHYTGNAQEFVVAQIDDLMGIVNGSLERLGTTIGDLVLWEPADWESYDVPLPDLDFNNPVEFAPVDPAIRDDFGEITPPDLPAAPSTAGIGSISVPTIPDFDPSIVGLAIPDPPRPISVQPPDVAPANPGFTYPTEPSITLPDQPQLTELTIPDFVGLSLPTFDPTFPTFSESAINTVIDWTEPTYTEEVIDEVKTQITTFFAGGSGVNPLVEEAVMARGRDREDRQVAQAEQQAEEEWANRGYTAPPGLLVQRVDQIREEGLIKKLGLNRELVIKTHDDELANLRFAVQQGIAAEQLYVQMHLAAVERLFEVQRLAIQWAIDLYNTAVEIFNARMREVQIRAQVYETQVRGELAKVEAYKAQVDAELAKAEINKTLVEMYQAEIQARETLINLYVAQIRAVAVQAEVYATEIQAYRAEVEAYAAEIDAEKTRFEAYESQIRGELGKASIVESEARAYSAEIQGISAGVQAQAESVRAQVARVQADISAFQAVVQGQIGRSQIELADVEANTRGFAADVQRYNAEVGLEVSRNQVNVAAWDAGQRQVLAYYGAQISKFNGILQGLLKESDLLLEALQTSGQLESTIASGGMAAIHVGATMAGNAGVTASGSDTVGFTQGFSKSCGRTVSVPTEEIADPGCDF